MAGTISDAILAVGDFFQQGEMPLRTETGRHLEGIAALMPAAAREVEPLQHRIRLRIINYRRHLAILQGLGRHSILDGRTHGVAGHAFGIADNDPPEIIAETAPQRLGLGLGAAAARRRIGFVRYVEQLRRQRTAVQAIVALDRGDKLLELDGKILDIDLGGMFGRVEAAGPDQLGDGDDAAPLRLLPALQDDADCPGAHDHAVAAAVKWNRRLVEVAFAGRRAGGEKTGAEQRQIGP